LYVFYEGLDKGTVVVHFRDQCWYLFKAGVLGGDPTPFTGDDLVAIAKRADSDRLKDAAPTNATSQVLEAFRIDRPPRLIGARLQKANGYPAELRMSDTNRHDSRSPR
jgi:hypothetical protein